MDKLHSLDENFTKVEALITTIDKIYKERKHFSSPTLIHEIESLKVLAEEAHESLNTLKIACDIINIK